MAVIRNAAMVSRHAQEDTPNEVVPSMSAIATKPSITFTTPQYSEEPSSLRRAATLAQCPKEEKPEEMVLDTPKIANRLSVASTSSYEFGDERMLLARRGMLHRQSLEISCLSAEGEDRATPSTHLCHGFCCSLTDDIF